MKSVFLGAVPERPVSANPGLVLVHFLYLPSYALLRVTFYVIIFFSEIKAQQCLVSSCYVFLDKKTLLKIWLNPGLNLTIFRGNGRSDRLQKLFIQRNVKEIPVVRRPISANAGINFNPGFSFFCLKAFSQTIITILFRASNQQIADQRNRQFPSSPGLCIKTRLSAQPFLWK